MPRIIPYRELEEAVQMFQAGVDAEQIGRLHGIAARTVLYRLAKRGLRYRRPRTQAERDAIDMRRGRIHLFRGQALTVGQMALQLGLRPRSLREWMVKYMPGLHDQMKAEVRARRAGAQRGPKVSPKPEPTEPLVLTRSRRAAIKRDYIHGYSIAAIARHYRHQRGTIWRLLRRQGAPMRPRTSRSPMWLRAMRRVREERGGSG